MASDGEVLLRATLDASGVETGSGAAKKSLASLAQTAGQTSDSMSKANARTSASIDRFVAKQQLAAQTMGKSATEAKLFELAQRGASAAQLKSAESALRAVDAYNRQEAAAARAQVAAAKFGMVIAAGSVLAAAAILNIGRTSVNALDQFNDLSDATGASVENISALDRVARENGQAFESTASILVRFNKVLTDTDDEGKKAAQVFKALGLDAEKLKAIDPAEALRQAAVALSQFANDGDKARAVQLLFGKSVQEAAPFLKDLAEKTELSGVASTKAAQQAEEFNKNLNRLKANASDTARSLVSDLLPALNKIFEKGKEQGFFALFGFDKEFFEKKKLAGLAGDVIFLDRELKRLKAGVATGILGPEALTQINEVTAALEKAKGVFREADKGFTPSTAGAGRGSVNPAFVTPGLGTVPDAPKAGSKKDPLAEAKQYLESLEKQLQVAKEMTVYERLLDDLKAKRFAVTPALERELKAAASTVDATKARAKAEDEVIKARERAIQMQQAADDAALANIETQIQTNQQLREEVEMLGLEGRARAAVEQARLSSAIALKEEELIMKRNADASATVLSSLEREIALLRERQGLIGARANREEAIDLSKATEKERKQFAEDMQSDLSGAFQAAFRSTDNPIKAFAETLASTVFERLSKAASDALADAFLSQMGGGDGGWVGLISSLFGGSSLAGAGGGAGNYNFGGGFDGGGYTGNGARSGGLDGKGGFMAMLHPKETVLDHTKGQGQAAGASITVVQHITTTDTVSKSELESKLRDSNRQMVAALDRSQRYGRG